MPRPPGSSYSETIVNKCVGESSIGSDDKHQYSQKTFSEENHNILNSEVHYKPTSSVLKFTSLKFQVKFHFH